MSWNWGSQVFSPLDCYLHSPIDSWNFLQKVGFLDNLVIFRLDLGRITFNLVETSLQHNSLRFSPKASRFSALWLGHVQKSEFWDSFWTIKWPKSLGFSIFGIFFPFPFISFSLLFAAVINLLLGLLAVKNLLRKCHQDGQLLPWSSQV